MEMQQNLRSCSTTSKVLYDGGIKNSKCKNFRGQEYCDGGIHQNISLRRDLSRYVFAKECAIRIDKQQKECYNNAVIDNGIII